MEQRTTSRFYTAFDRQQIDLLLPIAREDAVLHFPFFANTFPLGYHYFCALREMGHTTNVPDFLRLMDWARDGGSGPADVAANREVSKPQIFYTTGEFQHQAGQAGTVVPVAYYRPRLFFIRYDRSIAKLVVDGSGHLTPELLLHIGTWYDAVEIVTDIPEQAEILQTTLTSKDQWGAAALTVDVRVMNDWRSAFDFFGRRDGVLSIHFYGAPSTSALAARRHDFVPVVFPERPGVSDKKLETYAAIVAAEGDERWNAWIEPIRQYHERLFEMARQLGEASVAESFRDVWWAYNRYAAMLRHDSQFPTPQAFARCLTEFHIATGGTDVATPLPPTAVLDDPAPTHPFGDHVHFGAGHLSLGLVLPSLRYFANAVAPKSLVVIHCSRNPTKGSPLKRCRDGMEVHLTNGREFSAPFLVIVDSGGSADELTKRVLKESAAHPVLVSTQSITRLAGVIARATSFSSSVADGQGSLASALKGITLQPNSRFYAFENVVSPVLKDVFTSRPSDFINIVADRICSALTFRAKPRPHLAVSCERRGSIVLGAATGTWEHLFCRFVPEGSAVRENGLAIRVIGAPNAAIFEFHHHKKRWLMNSAHAVISVYGYYELWKSKAPRGHWRRQLVSSIQRTVLAPDREYRKNVLALIDGQIAHLILKTPQAIRQEVFDNLTGVDELDEERIYYDLRAYAQEVLDRIQEGVDEMGRVLDLDSKEKVMIRYDEFLNELDEFINANDGRMRALACREKAGVPAYRAGLSDVRRAAANIVSVANSR